MTDTNPPLVLPEPEPPAWIIAGTYAHARSHQSDAPDAVPLSPSVAARSLHGTRRQRLIVCRSSLHLADQTDLDELWTIIDTHRPTVTWLDCERP